MGWNSWNAFRCDINEALVKEVARAIVDSGLRDAGYQVSAPKQPRNWPSVLIACHPCVAQYVNLDDCWMEARDNLTGHILPFADKFPSGMQALGDYIHSLGLKFGIWLRRLHWRWLWLPLKLWLRVWLRFQVWLRLWLRFKFWLSLWV